MMHYLLDACAFIAVFNGEPCARRVLDLIGEAEIGSVRLFMSIVQLLEVYYDRIYIADEKSARSRVNSILAAPITIIETISYEVMYEAGRFKTSYSMSLADSIACATAKNLAATLVTKDGEMKAPEEAGEFPVLWLK